jgi:5-aminopentanamidase
MVQALTRRCETRHTRVALFTVLDGIVMSTWRIAGVQMDCLLGKNAANSTVIATRLREAAALEARLVLFPECALSGYGFGSKEQAWAHAETIPGPTTDLLAAQCRELKVWAALGMLEKEEKSQRLFNACALIGPNGEVLSYRKLHLPFLGVDRFATPGDRPLAVHDLGGLRVGINICYDGSFPEASRVLALMGADLILLPTNWPTKALCTAQYLAPARALENRIYYMAVNRVGDEAGFHFIGQSRILHCTGDLLALCDHDRPAILAADIDPARARQKRIIHVPGEYEIDRVHDRRPEMYGLLTEATPPRV